MLNRLLHHGPCWSFKLLPTYVIHLLTDVNNTQENKLYIYKPQIIRVITHFCCFIGNPIDKNKYYARRWVHFVIHKTVMWIVYRLVSHKTTPFMQICSRAITWRWNNSRLQLGPYFGWSLLFQLCYNNNYYHPCSLVQTDMCSSLTVYELMMKNTNNSGSSVRWGIWDWLTPKPMETAI